MNNVLLEEESEQLYQSKRHRDIYVKASAFLYDYNLDTTLSWSELQDLEAELITYEDLAIKRWQDKINKLYSMRTKRQLALTDYRKKLYDKRLADHKSYWPTAPGITPKKGEVEVNAESNSELNKGQ